MSPTSAQDQFSLEKIPSRIQSAKRIASVDGNVWYVCPPDCGKLAAIDTIFNREWVASVSVQSPFQPIVNLGQGMM